MRIEDFPLFWRWSQKSHAELPSHVLQTLTPVDPTLAHTLYERAVRIFQQPSSGERCCSSVDVGEARFWLLELSVPSDSRVTIVWNAELGVSLPWSVFADHWSDFCYPSSDDAFVFLPDGLGVISYEHYEQFRHRAAVA
jgi:hypothetical protein